MNNQLQQWHSAVHESAYLISIGKIDEAQKLLAKLDYELHDAVNQSA